MRIFIERSNSDVTPTGGDGGEGRGGRDSQADYRGILLPLTLWSGDILSAGVDLRTRAFGESHSVKTRVKVS